MADGNILDVPIYSYIENPTLFDSIRGRLATVASHTASWIDTGLGTRPAVADALVGGSFPLQICLNMKRRDGLRLARGLVDRHKGQIGRTAMESLPSLRVLCFHTNAHFHRSLTDIVHTGKKINDPAQFDRSKKVKVIHTGGDHRLATVALGCDGGSNIDP